MQSPAERSEFDNLGANMRADSLPADGLVISVREIQFTSFGPGHAEFVVLQAGRDVRVPTCFYIRIHPNRNSGGMTTAGGAAR